MRKRGKKMSLKNGVRPEIIIPKSTAKKIFRRGLNKTGWRALKTSPVPSTRRQSTILISNWADKLIQTATSKALRQLGITDKGKKKRIYLAISEPNPLIARRLLEQELTQEQLGALAEIVQRLTLDTQGRFTPRAKKYKLAKQI